MPSNPQLVFGCTLSIVFEIISSSIVSKQNKCVCSSFMLCLNVLLEGVFNAVIEVLTVFVK